MKLLFSHIAVCVLRYVRFMCHQELTQNIAELQGPECTCQSSALCIEHHITDFKVENCVVFCFNFKLG
jgi:hypothetical protein